MDIRFSCSQGHSLAVDPELAGRRVRCPVCREIVTAPEEEADDYIEAEEADDDEVEEERPRRGRRSRRDSDEEWEEEREPRRSGKLSKWDQLQKVKFGLNFHLWKYVCFVFAILLAVLGALLGTALFLFAIPFLILTSLISYAAPVLGIVGSIFCSWVPPRSQARTLILVSLGFDVASLGGMLVEFPAALIHPFMYQVFHVLSQLFGLTGFILFMIFMKKLAYYLRDEPDGDEAVSAMLGTVGVLIGGPVVIYLSAIVGRVIPLLGILLVIAEVVGWVVFLFIMLFRILTVIKDIRSQI